MSFEESINDSSDPLQVESQQTSNIQPHDLSQAEIVKVSTPNPNPDFSMETKTPSEDDMKQYPGYDADEDAYEPPETIQFGMHVFQYTVTLRYDPETRTESLMIEAEHSESRRLWTLRIDEGLQSSNTYNKKPLGPDTIFTIFKSTTNNGGDPTAFSFLGYSIEYPKKEKAPESDLQILINIIHRYKEACSQIDILLKPTRMSDTKLHERQIQHLREANTTMAKRVKEAEDKTAELENTMALKVIEHGEKLEGKIREKFTQLLEDLKEQMQLEFTQKLKDLEEDCKKKFEEVDKKVENKFKKIDENYDEMMDEEYVKYETVDKINANIIAMKQSIEKAKTDAIGAAVNQAGDNTTIKVNQLGAKLTGLIDKKADKPVVVPALVPPAKKEETEEKEETAE